MLSKLSASTVTKKDITLLSIFRKKMQKTNINLDNLYASD